MSAGFFVIDNDGFFQTSVWQFFSVWFFSDLNLNDMGFGTLSL